MSNGKIQLEIGFILQCMDIDEEKWRTRQVHTDQDHQQEPESDVQLENNDTYCIGHDGIMGNKKE